MKNELFISRYLSSALCRELHNDDQAQLRDPHSIGRLSEYLKLGGQLFFSQGSNSKEQIWLGYKLQRPRPNGESPRV